MKRRRRVTFPDGKTMLSHRYFWEWAHGPIPRGYVIHHKDGDIHNNDLDNLEALPWGEHSRLHALGNQRGLGNKSRTGQVNSIKTRKKIAVSLRGKPWSEERCIAQFLRRNMPTALRGKPWSAARRAAQHG